MAPGEASTYIREQMIQLQRQEQVAREQAIQREREQAQQALRLAAAPQYADHIIETLGLPKEAKGELLALGDPELMYRQSQAIKSRWDQFAQLQQKIQQYTQQNARTTEVNAMRQNGLTNIGGQAATGFTPDNLPSDPNERAMAIYEQIQARRAGLM
jgi:crotonobetainyl-CoA:carnitine CoA-transferase CaiB-like acyl-CoA transferase